MLLHLSSPRNHHKKVHQKSILNPPLSPGTLFYTLQVGWSLVSSAGVTLLCCNQSLPLLYVPCSLAQTSSVPCLMSPSPQTHRSGNGLIRPRDGPWGRPPDLMWGQSESLAAGSASVLEVLGWFPRQRDRCYRQGETIEMVTQTCAKWQRAWLVVAL